MDAIPAKFSVSVLYGICAGAAVKRMTQELAVGIGCGFIALQALSYYGFVTVHWGKIGSDITKAFDQDGDGRLTANDAKIALQKGKDRLSANIADGAGLMTGLAIGWKFIG